MLFRSNFHDRIFDGLLSVQFKQERPGVLEFRYQVGPQWRPDGVEAIRAGLLVKLGDDFQLTMRQVDETEKTAAGKHRWLITSLKPPFAD